MYLPTRLVEYRVLSNVNFNLYTVVGTFSSFRIVTENLLLIVFGGSRWIIYRSNVSCFVIRWFLGFSVLKVIFLQITRRWKNEEKILISSLKNIIKISLPKVWSSNFDEIFTNGKFGFSDFFEFSRFTIWPELDKKEKNYYFLPLKNSLKIQNFRITLPLYTYLLT